MQRDARFDVELGSRNRVFLPVKSSLLRVRKCTSSAKRAGHVLEVEGRLEERGDPDVAPSGAWFETALRASSA